MEFQKQFIRYWNYRRLNIEKAECVEYDKYCNVIESIYILLDILEPFIRIYDYISNNEHVVSLDVIL